MQYSLETVIYFEKSRSVALQYFFAMFHWQEWYIP